MLDFLIPPICPGCGDLIESGERDCFCPICRGKWEQEKRMRCPACGQEERRCECPIALPNGERIPQVHLSCYRQGGKSITGRMILRAKDKKLAVHRRLWGKELAPRLRAILQEEEPILSYIPRNPKKVRVTGTDQARELARGIGKALDLSVTSLFLATSAEDQKNKTAAERFDATISRYRLRPRMREYVKGRRVWLCDDVITTGATMMACKELLCHAGATEVLAIAVARTRNDRIETGGTR